MRFLYGSFCILAIAVGFVLFIALPAFTDLSLLAVLGVSLAVALTPLAIGSVINGAWGDLARLLTQIVMFPLALVLLLVLAMIVGVSIVAVFEFRWWIAAGLFLTGLVMALYSGEGAAISRLRSGIVAGTLISSFFLASVFALSFLGSTLSRSSSSEDACVDVRCRPD